MYAKYVVLENLPRLNCLPFTAAVSCVRVTKLQYHNIGSLVEAKFYHLDSQNQTLIDRERSKFSLFISRWDALHTFNN